MITSEPAAPRAGRRGVDLPTVLMLTGITVAALALRLPSFTDSLFGDEISTNFVVNGFGAGSLLHIVEGDQEGTPPLFFSLTSLTKGLGGAEGLRIVSLVAGLASIPLVYLLGLRTLGRRAAIVAAVLVALSPFQIYYSTEARAYELSMVLVLVVGLTLLEAVRSDRWAWWVGYALATAAAVYTHYTAIFLLVGLFVWAFLSYPNARRWLILSTLGAALLFVPWLPVFLGDTDEPAAKIIELLHPLTFPNAVRDLVHLFFGHPYISAGVMPGHFAVWLIVAGIVVGLAGHLIRLRAGGLWPYPGADTALVLVLFLAAPVGAALHNVVAPSVFSARNLITAWPGFALTVGAVVSCGRMPFRLVAVGLVVAGFAVGAVKMLDKDHQRPDLRDAVAFIDRVGGPDSPVVEAAVASPGIQSPLEAALAPQGKPLPTSRRIFPLSYPTMDARLEVAEEGQIALLRRFPGTPSEAEIARQAAGEAGTGKLFLVNLGTPTLTQLRLYPGPVANFLAALPPRFHEIEFRVFPGFNVLQVSVHVLEGTRARPAG